MSYFSDAASNPSWGVAKIIFTAYMGSMMLTTFISGFRVFWEVATTKVNTMIFGESISDVILWVGLIIGVLAIAGVGYWFKYQDYMMKNDVSVKFDVRYIVSALLTIAVATFFAYICVFFGTFYVLADKVIEEAPLAFMIAFVVGAVSSWLVDACLFHPLADGTMAAAYNKAQKVARELLASKEAQEALFQAVRAKCAAGGVSDPESIEKIISMISGPEDDKLADLIGYFASKEKKVEAPQTVA